MFSCSRYFQHARSKTCIAYQWICYSVYCLMTFDCIDFRDTVTAHRHVIEVFYIRLLVKHSLCTFHLEIPYVMFQRDVKTKNTKRQCTKYVMERRNQPFQHYFIYAKVYWCLLYLTISGFDFDTKFLYSLSILPGTSCTTSEICYFHGKIYSVPSQ